MCTVWSPISSMACAGAASWKLEKDPSEAAAEPGVGGDRTGSQRAWPVGATPSSLSPLPRLSFSTGNVSNRSLVVATDRNSQP